MFGVLLVEDALGQPWVLKAFSGLLKGKSDVEGWVPLISGRDRSQLGEANCITLEESRTLLLLDDLKHRLLALNNIPERQQYAVLQQEFETRLHILSVCHRQRKQSRDDQRQRLTQILVGETLAQSLEVLNDESRRDGLERRQLKQERDANLLPLRHVIDQANHQIGKLKQQRKTLSQALQAQMQRAYWLTNFLGESRSLHQLMPYGAVPTGTGDCCAPKLLHYAATHQLKPLAMAEFWWGASSANGDKVEGNFYGACRDRCQPLMGFLLSGLSLSRLSVSGLSQHLEPSALDLPIIYEDEWLLVVNKPSGLLSVPGRYRHTQDSVVSRLQCAIANREIFAVHRLDQDTSGLLLLAHDRATYQILSQQFQQRRVHKVYEAILAESIESRQGMIELPLWSDPCDRPKQKVDWQRGKPSATRFQVSDRAPQGCRLEFVPLTGRTHQIRVHAADKSGIGVPILGDRLYGSAAATRLHLHARELTFDHPRRGQRLHLQAATPF